MYLVDGFIPFRRFHTYFLIFLAGIKFSEKVIQNYSTSDENIAVKKDNIGGLLVPKAVFRADALDVLRRYPPDSPPLCPIRPTKGSA